MIHYAISLDELLSRIDAHDDTWRARARRLTRKVVAKGHVDDKDAIWGEVKAVFAEVQGFKCIYCEKPMPEEELTMGRGAGEYDVEHYRPKNGVKPWPDASREASRGIKYARKLSTGEAKGYARLALDPTNYGVSCKTCNSGHKANAFPIAGKTNPRLRTRARLDAVERPMLPLPIGDWADDPAAFLGWVGPLPVPVVSRGHGRLRAQVCVDLLSLDKRADLLSLRATAITLLWPKLQGRGGAASPVVQALQAPNVPMAGCSRAFVSLYARDKAQAKAIARACEAWLVSKDPAVLGALLG